MLSRYVSGRLRRAEVGSRASRSHYRFGAAGDSIHLRPQGASWMTAILNHSPRQSQPGLCETDGTGELPVNRAGRWRRVRPLLPVGCATLHPGTVAAEAPDLAAQRTHGVLYVVATPIGNLDDISGRACAVLREVDMVLAEDTRRTRKLFGRYGISTPTRAFHEHNEREEARRILDQLLSGKRFALVSDAGTPLVSDPGYVLVREARSHHVPVYCVPGPSAVTAALSVSGLPTDRFSFEGFLPARRSRRLHVLEALASETRTMVFYEAPHRIVDALADLCVVFGNDREAAIARELTKRFESVSAGCLDDLLVQARSGRIPNRGEVVVIVRGGATAQADDDTTDAILEAMLDEGVAVRQTAAVAARLTGQPRNVLYRRALGLAATRTRE